MALARATEESLKSHVEELDARITQVISDAEGVSAAVTSANEVAAKCDVRLVRAESQIVCVDEEAKAKFSELDELASKLISSTTVTQQAVDDFEAKLAVLRREVTETSKGEVASFVQEARAQVTELSVRVEAAEKEADTATRQLGTMEKAVSEVTNKLAGVEETCTTAVKEHSEEFRDAVEAVRGSVKAVRTENMEALERAEETLAAKLTVLEGTVSSNIAAASAEDKEKLEGCCTELCGAMAEVRKDLAATVAETTETVKALKQEVAATLGAAQAGLVETVESQSAKSEKKLKSLIDDLKKKTLGSGTLDMGGSLLEEQQVLATRVTALEEHADSMADTSAEALRSQVMSEGEAMEALRGAIRRVETKTNQDLDSIRDSMLDTAASVSSECGVAVQSMESKLADAMAEQQDALSQTADTIKQLDAEVRATREHLNDTLRAQFYVVSDISNRLDTVCPAKKPVEPTPLPATNPKRLSFFRRREKPTEAEAEAPPDLDSLPDS